MVKGRYRGRSCKHLGHKLRATHQCGYKKLRFATNGDIRPSSRCAEFFEKAQISERGMRRRRKSDGEVEGPMVSFLDASSLKL